MDKTDTNQEPLPKDLCPEFKTKTMTLNTEYRRNPFEDQAESCTAHFWCMLTMDVHGPDDDDVMPHECLPGRSCYDSRHPKA